MATDYASLPLVGPLLARLGVTSREALLALDLEAIAGQPGVGWQKVAALGELMQRVKDEPPPALPPAPAPHPHGQLPTCWLGRLPPNVQAQLEHQGARTVQEAADWLGAGAPGDRVGKKSRLRLAAALEALAARGPARVIFGLGTEPTTTEGLAEAYLAHLPAGAGARAVTRHFRDGVTYEQIASEEEPPVSRERIRQRLEHELRADGPAWSGVALGVTRQVRQALADGRGVALVPDGAKAWCLQLALELAGEPCRRTERRGHPMLCWIPDDDLNQLCREVNLSLEEPLRRGARMEELAGHCHELGVRLNGEPLLRWLEALLGVQQVGAVVYSARRDVQPLYAEALRSLGGAATVRELLAVMAARHPELDTSPRTAASALMRCEAVYKAGPRTWIHAAHLPVPATELEAIARALLARVPRSGEAVSVKQLVRGAPEGFVPHGLSPFSLRDALVRTGKVRSWMSSCDVAWKEGAVHRRGISEHLLEVAEEAGEPITRGDLVDEVARRSDYKPESVEALLSAGTGLLALGDGTYLAESVAFPGGAEREAVLAEVARAIPADRVTSAELLAKTHPALKSLASAFGPGVGWALGKELPGVRHRIAGRLLWRASLGDTAWEALAGALRADLSPEFSLRQLSHWLAESLGAESRNLPYRLVEEGSEQGALAYDPERATWRFAGGGA